MMNRQPSSGPQNDKLILPSNFDFLSAQRPSFWKSVLDLPRQYFDAIIDPDIELFTAARQRASWGLILFQLLGVALLLVIAALVFQLIGQPGQGPFISLFPLALVGIVIFFLAEGILFLIAKSFRGEGSFKQQCYTALLLEIPWSIILAVALLAVGINLIFAIYFLCLRITVLRAVHNMSRGKAIITLLVFIGVACVVSFLSYLVRDWYTHIGSPL